MEVYTKQVQFCIMNQALHLLLLFKHAVVVYISGK